MENPIKRIAAKFQYKKSHHYALSLLWTPSHGLEVVRIERVVFSYKDLEAGRLQLMWTLSSAPTWEIGAENPFSGMLLLLLLLLFLLLLSLLLLLSSMMILVIGFTCPPTIHFKNYYKVRQLFHYKLRHVLSQSAIGITKCGRTLHEWIINLLVLYMYSSYTPRPPSVQKNSNSSSGLLLIFIALVFLTLIFNTSLL